MLGRCYAEGLGVPADTKTAVEYFRRAVYHGHAESAEELQKLELGGDGDVEVEADVDADDEGSSEKCVVCGK